MSGGLNAALEFSVSCICAVTLGTGFPAFSSSQPVVSIPLNLRFGKLGWNEEDTVTLHHCALTEPRLCTLLNSLQRVEFCLFACHILV